MKNLVFFLFFASQAYSQLEIPALAPNESFVQHTAYAVSFNSHYKQANWVAYLLTKEETQKAAERNNKFTADPQIPGTNFNKDYAKSGYDRGHLAPAGDMSFSVQTMKESFYFSNMSPQIPAFNRGIWKNLETQVRTWASEKDSLCIVTGPVFTDSMLTIGKSKIAVPNSYYKVILDCHKGKEHGIAFILPNAASHDSLNSFVISIDYIEEQTGLDFFPLLDDVTEERVEMENKYWE